MTGVAENQVSDNAEAPPQPVEVDDGWVESVQLAGYSLPVLAPQQRWIGLIGPVPLASFS